MQTPIPHATARLTAVNLRNLLGYIVRMSKEKIAAHYTYQY